MLNVIQYSLCYQLVYLPVTLQGVVVGVGVVIVVIVVGVGIVDKLTCKL